MASLQTERPAVAETKPTVSSPTNAQFNGLSWLPESNPPAFARVGCTFGPPERPQAADLHSSGQMDTPELAYGINWEPESAIVLCVVTVSNRGDSALSAGLLCPLNVPEELRGDSPPVWEVGIIAPGETFLGVYQRIDGTHFSKAKLDVRVGTNPGVAWIEYRDAAGNYWRRLGDGALERRNGPWQPSEDHQPQ